MNKVSSVSFGANFIRTIPVKKYVPEKNIYRDIEASFIEFELNKKDDYWALREIEKEFRSEYYCADILYAAGRVFMQGNKPDLPTSIYALTTQSCKHKKGEAFVVLPEKVLGLAETELVKDGYSEVVHLQTHPDYICGMFSQRFKRVGTAILEGLKDLNDKLCLRSVYSATNFYKQNGFHELRPNSRWYIWERKK